MNNEYTSKLSCISEENNILHKKYINIDKENKIVLNKLNCKDNELIQLNSKCSIIKKDKEDLEKLMIIKNEKIEKIEKDYSKK